MRKIFSILLLTVISSASFCQQLSSSEKLTKPETDYLKRAHHQRILGNTLTWTGVGIIGGTILMNNFANNFIWESSKEEKQQNFNELLPFYVTGTVLMGTGVGFLIAAGNNREKASLSLNLKMDQSQMMKGTNLSRVSYPAVHVSFKF